MQTIHTFSVLFWLKLANKKDNKAPPYARVTVNGRRAEISLKRKVTVSDWDTSKNRIKGFGSEAKLMNNFLDGVHSKPFECYQKLKSANKLVSPQLIKTHFLGDGENRYAISDIIEYHKEHMKDTLRWGT